MNKKEFNYFLNKFNEDVGEYCTYAKDLIKEALDDMGIDCEILESKGSQVVDESRWSIVREEYYKIEDFHFCVSYDDPATEMQEGQPTDMQAYEVKPVEVTVTEYKKVQ